MTLHTLQNRSSIEHRRSPPVLGGLENHIRSRSWSSHLTTMMVWRQPDQTLGLVRFGRSAGWPPGGWIIRRPVVQHPANGGMNQRPSYHTHSVRRAENAGIPARVATLDSSHTYPL